MNPDKFSKFRRTIHFHSENYEFGFQSEKNLLPILSDYFASDLQSLPEGDSFDFYSKKIESKFELKTRRCKKSQYFDTTFSKRKIDDIQKNDDFEYYFIFKFTDELCYWKFDRTTNLREYHIHGVNHVFIPIKNLVTIC